MPKPILVNGVAVAEMDFTGDMEVDTAGATALLKSLGLHREVSKLQAMWRQATSFSHVSSDIYKKGLTKSPRDPLRVAPFAVNTAFALELYLKTLYEIHSGSAARIHKLVDALPAPAVADMDKVSPVLAAEWTIEDGSFRPILERLNNTFVKWRYVYEGEGTTAPFHVREAIYICNVLHEACRLHKDKILGNP